MKRSYRLVAATVVLLLSLTGCMMDPGGGGSSAGGMTVITFIIDVYDAKTGNTLNVPAHTTIYLETVADSDIFTVDGKTGAADVFPFDVPGDPNIPGSYPITPVRQNVYYDTRNGDFRLTAKATVTGPAGTVIRCSVEDIHEDEIAPGNTILILNQVDTLTVECSY
jgi:hypothetical protein